MSKTPLWITLLLTLSVLSFRSDKPAYILYNGDGKEIRYKQFIDGLKEADIILFGEEHNDPIAHWLELEVAKELAGKDRTLVMGAEMFETDNQLLLDEYFSGKISQSNFEKESRLWDNYQTDYKPLVEFARQQKIRFVATNIPRRYASLVSRQGFKGLDSLSDQAKSFMPPLPVDYDPELPGYKNMLEMMGAHSEMGVAVNPEYFPQAQAVKDATMACFILKNLPAGQRFLHFNGAYHSNHFEGIVWYLKKARPDLKILTISTVEIDDPETLSKDNLHSADYIIAVPSDMTKTF